MELLFLTLAGALALYIWWTHRPMRCENIQGYALVQALREKSCD